MGGQREGKMYTTLKLNVTRILILATAMLGIVTLMQTVPAHAAEKKEDVKKPTASTQKAETYTYVTQSGDSYSKLARKAIQTYGIQNKVKLSAAEIIAAETKLTQEAGSPMLTQGQKVTIEKSTVKKWADASLKLSAADEAKWQKYTVNVNFDTRSVGE